VNILIHFFNPYTTANQNSICWLISYREEVIDSKDEMQVFERHFASVDAFEMSGRSAGLLWYAIS